MESSNDVFPYNARRKGMKFNKNGWGPSLILDAQGRSTRELKPKHEWNKTENKGSEANARALFSVFNGVCPNKFCRIANCKYVKKA